MKPSYLAPSVALAILLATSCDKNSPDVAKQLAELERKATEAIGKQRELETQIEEQKLAAERDAIERERMRIEEDRADLERQQGDAAAAEEEKLRQREIDLAAREGKVELIQSQLQEKEGEIQQRDQELSERDRELAGREAIAADYDNDEASAPVGDYGMFYDSLSSYGSWFETPDYGYVWQPAIVRDSSWRPYTRGRWVCSDRGWTWVSYEPFGWATYHYGRWALCHGHGWVWVPGSVWAPAWVSWRSGGNQIGWAPLPPESLAWSGGWDSSVDTTFCISTSWYCFVETRYFCEPIYNHCLPYHQNHVYYGLSTNCTNIHERNRRIICGGPSYGDIERQTKRRPPYYRIEEDRRGRASRERIDGGRLRVASPNLDAAWNAGLKPTKVKGRMETVKVERQEELRPEVAERFRLNREDNRRKAEQSIAELGGLEKLNEGRMQTLETNRRKVEESTRRNEKERNSRPRTEQGKIADNHNDRKSEPAGKREDGPRDIPAKDPNQLARESAARLRKQQEEIAEQTRQRAEARRVLDQPGNRDDRPQITPPKDRGLATNENPEPIRRQREQAVSQPEKREDRPKITPPREEPGRAQDDSAARMRKQQQEQADNARQQQQEANRQREQARQQQQMEESKREQARQQQEAQREQARQQQQEAQRQQQMEEARREQARAREQQMEESRREQQREQARQQQQEENRREQQREQARQQQQEESRREQSRQQEESNRREQQRQEEERRGRNR